MVHAWDAFVLALCLALMAVALVRGMAGVLVARNVLPRLEAIALTIAGVVGLIGVLVVGRLLH